MSWKTVEMAAEMNCKACQYRIEKALKQLEAVRSFKTNLRRQAVTIEFDPSHVEEAQLRKVIDTALTHGLSFE